MTNFTDFKNDFSQYTNDFGVVTGILNEKDIFKNIHTIYGVPMCALDIVKSTLIHILPTSFLVHISKAFDAGYKKAGISANAAVQHTFLQNSLYVYNPVTGRFEWNETSNDFLGDDNDLGFLGEMSLKLADIQGQAAFYANMVNGTLNQINDLLNCIGKYLAWEASKKESNPFKETFGPVVFLEAKLSKDAEFIKTLSEAQDIVTKEIYDRSVDPTLEPLNLAGEVITSPFRLVYGPPKSVTGQFVLSVDGIYYDSQSGGIPFIDTDEHTFMASGEFPESADVWKLQHYPSLGGKGEIISIESSKKYTDTVFSLDLVDNSVTMLKFYEVDPLLNKIIGQKNIEISKLKSHVDDLLGSYTEDSALVVNGRQSLQSVAAKYGEKIDKRKKQIELYVKYSSTAKVGDHVPVNDFSYITNEAMAPELSKQKKLIFRQGELDGVVLPVQPKFVKAKDSSKVSSFAHLAVGEVGSGEVINMSTYDNSAGSLMNLVDEITTDSLVGIYNFLQSNTGSVKSTYNYNKDYKLVNSINESNFGQLVGDSSAIFVSGLSIPKIDGISNDSYMLLPDTSEYQDLTYKKAGFSVDFWTHMPNINDASAWTDSSYRRVLLSCDNVGSEADNYTTSTLVLSKTSTNTRGLQMGFATHRQLGKGLPVSETDSENGPDDQLVFYMAPTQSYGGSSVGFLNKTDALGCIITNDTLNSIIVDTSSVVSGISFNDVSSAFMHVSVAVNPILNNVSVYLDSVLMASSTMNDVFGVKDFNPAQLPSISVSGSYDPTGGPPINPSLFTPWIIGSSFVDKSLGLDSGYKAHVGSLKIYAKALNSSEVLSNFNAQRGYFKNIAI